MSMDAAMKVKVGADTSEMEKGFDAAISAIQELTKSINQLNTTFSNFKGFTIAAQSATVFEKAVDNVSAGVAPLSSEIKIASKSFDEIKGSVFAAADAFNKKWDQVVAKAETDAVKIVKANKSIIESLREASTKSTTYFDNIGKAGSKAGEVIGKSKSNYTGITRVIQDLPYGFNAISNNLEQLVPVAGAAGLAFSGLVAALTFVSIGFGAWTRGMGDNSKALEAQKKAAEKAKEELESYNKSLDSAKSGAIASGVALQTYANIARDGQRPLAERNEALKEANKILGEHGAKLTLVNINTAAATVEINKFTAALVAQALASKFSDHIADTIIKQKDALEQLNKAQEDKQKLLATIKNEQRRGDFDLGQYNRVIDANNKIALAQNAVRDTAIDIRDTYRRLNETTSESVKLFSELGHEDKTDKKVKTIADAMKDLSAAMHRIDTSEGLGAITPTDADTQRLSAYSTALSQLFERGATSANSNVKDVVEGMRQLRTIGFKDVSGPRTSRELQDKPTKVSRIFDSIDQNDKLHILDQIINKQKEAEKATKSYQDAIIDLGKSLTGTFENVFNEVVVRGGNAMQAFGKYIQALIAKLIAAAAVSAILSAFTGGFGGAASGGGFAKIFGQLSGLKGLIPHAEGGIFTGPTRIGNHLFGESGAEALIPLNRMSEMMGKIGGGGRMEVFGEFELRNDRLVAAVKKGNNQFDRTF